MKAMNRKDWEEHGVLVLACFVLYGYLLVEQVPTIIANRRPSGIDDVRLAAVFLLPVSAFFSAQTVVHFASRFVPAIGWWLHGLLRWTFYGMLHALAAAALTGMVDSVSPRVTDGLRIAMMAGIPFFLLVRQIVRDYVDARRRFGSLAQAERAFLSKARENSPSGGRE